MQKVALCSAPTPCRCCRSCAERHLGCSTPQPGDAYNGQVPRIACQSERCCHPRASHSPECIAVATWASPTCKWRIPKGAVGVGSRRQRCECPHCVASTCAPATRPLALCADPRNHALRHRQPGGALRLSQIIIGVHLELAGLQLAVLQPTGDPKLAVGYKGGTAGGKAPQTNPMCIHVRFY